MANQIVVTQSGNVQVSIQPTPNVQVQISRAAITTLTDVPTANFANFAGNVTGANQPNITNIGTLTNLAVSGNTTLNNVVVTGNLAVGNLVANSANFANFAGVANIANSVAVANVVGIGNIATVNLDGNAGNILYGNGVFASTPVISNVANANYANFAGQVVDATQSNITSVGTLTGLSIAGNIIPTSNIAYDLGNNTNRFNDLYLAGNTIYLGQQEITANATSVSFTGNLTGNATGLSNIPGANVTGAVANATFANTANTANSATVANSANSVAVANVSGIGNIATVNLDGNASNILYGNGVFATTPVISNVANANYANFSGTAFSVSGSNVSGAVANAIYADNAGNANLANLATFATTANAVAGANVSGTVANANYSAFANIAASANSVAVANVSGIGNIATVNLDGSSSNVLFGNGVFAPESTSIANANYANFAGTAFNVSGSNVSGEVANAAYANIAGVANSVAGANVSGEVSFAATANSVAGANVSGTVANATFAANAGNANVANTANSVAVANVSGIGNIATINLDGSSSNVLYGNGVFAPESTSIANANYANFAGDVVNSAQPNITSVGNLPYLQVSNSANSTGVIRQTSSGNITYTTSAANTATFQITTLYHPNSNVGYPSDRTIRSRGNVASPTAVSSGDRILTRTAQGFNGNTNPLSVSETFTIVGLNANANAIWTGGQWNITTGNPQGNTANQESSTWQNQLIFTNSGSFQINPGTVANSSAGQSTAPILITNYGLSTTDLAGAGGFNQQKARGNRDALSSVQASDFVGRINMWGYNGANYQSARPAALIAQVDSSYITNATIIPLNMIIRTVNSSNVSVDTTFFGNTLTRLPGNINFSSSTANLFTGSSGQVALGIDAGSNVQGSFSVAIGRETGQTNQGTQSLAVGFRAGQTNQGNSALAFGDNAGANAQNPYGVAIGAYAGANLQGNNSVAFGTNAGRESQGNISVAIGSGAAQTNQGVRSVAIGSDAGSNTQGEFSVAVGLSAGYNNQATQSVAIGYYAGANTQGAYSVAIGRQAGEFTQGSNSFALGYAAASNNQGNNSIAFGWAAGLDGQGSNAIAIGALAGQTNQANNSIILNATGGGLNQTTANTFTVKPVRNANTANVMFYNNSTGEISYDTLANNTSNVSAANVTINSGGFMKLASYTEAALTAITGQIGWMAAVSDSAQGSNPNGMIAFWDTTNTRWSYIHDNSAV
jgi:hypothetical protein